MRITPQVALVGSGANGMSLSNQLDCNVYLVNGGEQSALLDAGCGLEPERILSRIKTTGVDPRTIRQVLLTHCHADHSAGARFWHKNLRAEVVVPKASSAALSKGDEDAVSLPRAKAAGTYPTDFVLPPVPVARSVEEGDVVEVGAIRLEVLSTPGHSFDHVSYLLRDGEEPMLFSGDVLLTDGRIMLLDTPDCQIGAYGQTIRRLADLHLDALMPGHGAFTLRGAGGLLRRAASYFDRMVVPPSWS